MKTTVDIPIEALSEAMKHTGAKTKRQAIVTAIVDFNRRQRMAALVRHAGSYSGFVNPAELKRQRRKP